jgi:hypothetical protein
MSRSSAHGLIHPPAVTKTTHFTNTYWKLIPDTPDITSNQTDSVPVPETWVSGFSVKISPKVNRTLEIPTSSHSHTTDCLSLPELLRSRHRLQRDHANRRNENFWAKETRQISISKPPLMLCWKPFARGSASFQPWPLRQQNQSIRTGAQMRYITYIAHPFTAENTSPQVRVQRRLEHLTTTASHQSQINDADMTKWYDRLSKSFLRCLAIPISRVHSSSPFNMFFVKHRSVIIMLCSRGDSCGRETPAFKQA